ncbi:MAG: LysM peptidoglycan-binding domain-containing protein [Candidatus Sericytochromatia bacterium]
MPRLQPTVPPIPTPRPATAPSDTPQTAIPVLSTVRPSQPASLGTDQLQVSVQGSASPSVSLDTAPQFTLHTVKRGETLGKIANQYLGNANRHPEIYQANRDDLRNPNDLRIGMTLKIPVPPSAVPSTPIQLPQEPAPPVAPAQPVAPTQPTAPAEASYSQYTVKRGESLSSIALDTLGDSERYMEIFQANRDVLKDPDALRLGMTLKIPQRNGAPASSPTQGAAPAGDVGAVDATGLNARAQELFGAMQRYQQHHAALGNTNRTKTTTAQMHQIARELDSAATAFGVDPKMMLALYAHESGGINPGARSHTGAGGLGQLTSIAIRQVHFMAGMGKGAGRGSEPYNDYKSNFIQNSRAIRERYDIKANVWTSVAYMSYELNDRARLGRGVENALKRYGDPNVSTYANKVNAEYRTLFGGKLF